MDALNFKGEIERPLADFPVDIWENPLTSFSVSDLGSDADKEKHRVLKERVKEMLMASKANPIDNIMFIDVLCRLGVSYHFEKEIEEQMDMIFSGHDLSDMLRDQKYDLCTVGIVFQVFRQFGYKLSAHVFETFKDEDGKFKETLGANAKAMVSLYEAAQWSTRGEDTLDEALVFSRSHLEALASRSIPYISIRIKNALKHPYHKGITRIETRHYISYYQEEPQSNEVLLEFAKLDFNILQLLHREEIAQVTRWYKHHEIESKVPHARKRIVESYLWAVGAYFEPQYSRARYILTTVLILLTLLDDTYDAYGTPDELDILTNALNRWLPTAPNELRESEKHVYHCLISFYDKVEKEMDNEGRLGCGFHLRNSIISLANSYHQEAKWLKEDYNPTFDEYKENALLSSGYYAVLAASFVGMEAAKLDAFEWLTSRPKLLVASDIINRLTDDISSYEFEHQRKHVGTSIDWYMKQYGVSKDKAVEKIRIMISDSWKDLNQELLRPHSLPFAILMRALNLSRVIEVFYKYKDAFTNSELLKDYNVSLFSETIPI